MQCTLHSIEKYCGSTNAGLRQIQLIVPDDVLSIGLIQSQPSILGNIELKPGTQSYDVRFDRQTARFSEIGVNERSGDLYRRTLTFELIHDRYDVSSLIQKLKNRRVHVLITDRNGYKRFSPNMRLTHETDTGDEYTSKSRNRLTFTGTGKQKVKFLSGSLVEDSTETTGWILQSSGGLNFELKINSCGAIVTVTTAIAGVSEFEINNWTVTVGEYGELITKAGLADTDSISLTSPSGMTYNVSVDSCGAIITTPTIGPIPEEGPPIM